MLEDDDSAVLGAVRLDKARIFLRDAETNMTVDSFLTSVNRSYYCIYHAMRAVLALERFDSKKHSGVISQFRRNYIKTGIFPSTLSDIITKSFRDRNDSDYNDYYLISKDDVAAQIENAKTFLAAVEGYLAPKLADTRGEA
jgi:uncharacterized protein (UPF0332 family)